MPIKVTLTTGDQVTYPDTSIDRIEYDGSNLKLVTVPFSVILLNASASQADYDALSDQLTGSKEVKITTC